MRYAALFGVRVRHDYYPDAVCRDLRFEPTAQTRRLLRGYRLALRELPDGIAVSAPLDADGKSALIALRRDEAFAFDLRVSNPDFSLFTDLRGRAGKTDPVYTNAGLAAKDGRALKLAERKPAAGARCDAPRRRRAALRQVDAGAGERRRGVRGQVQGAGGALGLLPGHRPRGPISRIVDSSGAASALGFSAANRTLLNKSPDETDPLAAAMARQYPALQRVRFLSDQPMPCSSAARKGLKSGSAHRRSLTRCRIRRSATCRESSRNRAQHCRRRTRFTRSSNTSKPTNAQREPTMANQPATPGVYVEEISTLPPSVAEVATAVPAFIGYTKTGPADAADPVHVRVATMLEFETAFGGPQRGRLRTSPKPLTRRACPRSSPGAPAVRVFAVLRVEPLFPQRRRTVLCGLDRATTPRRPSRARFSAGLTALEREDEPTLIVLTDAACLLSPSDYYTLCGEALAAMQEARRPLHDPRRAEGRVAGLQKRRQPLGQSDVRRGLPPLSADVDQLRLQRSRRHHQARPALVGTLP